MKNINITLPEIDKNQKITVEFLHGYYDAFESEIAKIIIGHGFTETEFLLLQLFSREGKKMTTFIKNITKNANKLLNATKKGINIKLININEIAKLGI